MGHAPFSNLAQPVGGDRRPVRAYHRGMTDASIAATGARYGHTNLIARDWRLVAGFYERLFGCVPVPPERHYRGPDLERGTGVPGAALRGVHLLTDPEGNIIELQSWVRAA